MSANPETQTSGESAARIAADCPPWCVRHSATSDGPAHHTEGRRFREGSVWAFSLPSGAVRIGIGGLTLPAGQWDAEPKRLAELLHTLGREDLAAAVDEQVALVGAGAGLWAAMRGQSGSRR